ncbi:hypothetical protein FHR83_008959 [Actinoplanes campanulatus]|uniref:Uncharacterized protein n=1 Tax=Actinoplanes campanulatus TaxID=113559 RepID=A0A7W5FK17_9ACTN|nr:hypothetical protein [Actinoplanes campanulatus]MBB3101231.1 hypothetical protein [Actinoplanes campanulatus]
MFRLERGATGFRHGKEPDLPEVPLRRFRAGCHEAARRASGAVEQIRERAYPRNYHSAAIMAPEGRFVILCHAVHPWIAFAEEDDPGTFSDPPAWATAYTDMGFVVMSRELLDSPLSDVDTTALGKGEWMQINSWRPESTGRAVFNSWD